ncbi:MAG: TolC family protein [Elusimicrobiota bacterium]
MNKILKTVICFAPKRVLAAMGYAKQFFKLFDAKIVVLHAQHFDVPVMMAVFSNRWKTRLRRNFHLLILPMTLVAASIPAVAQKNPLRATLSAAVMAALRHSPHVEAAQAQTQANLAGLSDAKSKRLPSLTATSSLTRGDNPVYVFSSLLQQRNFGAQNFAIDSLNNPGYITNIQNSIELGVPIFTGFDLEYGQRLADLALAQARSGEDLAGQRVRYQTTEAYLQILMDSTMLGMLEKRLDSSSREIQTAGKLEKKGLIPGSDYYAAQAIFEGLKAWQIHLKSDLAAGRSRLALLTAIPPESLSPAGELTDKIYDAPTEDALAGQALQHRPELRQAELQNSAVKVLRHRAVASLLPKVEAFAALQTNTNDFGSNPASRLFGVQASLPIGDPSYFFRVARAKAQEQKSRADQEAVAEDIRLEISQTYKAYRGDLDGLPILKEMIARADKALNLTVPLYREGRQSIMEVLRAEEGDAQAHASYLRMLYDMHRSYARLLLAAGRLDDSAILEINSHLEAAR